MAEPISRWFDAPTAGEAPDLPPDLMSGKHARVLRNFLVHHPGRIVPRGNIGGAATPLIGDASHSTGAPMGPTFQQGDGVILSYKDPTVAATVDTWRVPINKPTLAAQLTQPIQGAQGGRGVDMATGTVTDLAIAVGSSTLNNVSGWRYAALGGVVYTNTYGGASTAVSSGVAQLSCVLKTSGSGVKLLNGPLFVQDVFSHLGRIWVAAARDPGGSNYEPNSLYYTIPGGTTALTDVVTDWQDPVTGALNKISVGDPSDGDFLVGLGRANGHMVIFMRHSIWIMYGTSPANLVLRQLRTLHGCVDARSIAVCDEGVYFASQRGYELFDGDAFELVSEAVSDTWLEFSNRGPAASTVNHSYIVATPLYNNYLFISLGTQPHAASQPDGAERNWLLYTPAAAWIDLKTAMASLGLPASGAFNRATRTTKFLALWGASEWARADQLTFGAPSTGLLDQDAGASYSVPLVWTTRLDNLADGRWRTSTLHSATADYHQHYTTTDPPALDAWGTLSAVDGFGDSLLPAQSLPGFDTPGPVRSRPTYTPKHEANRGDLSFTLSSDIGASATKRHGELNIYGLGIQYLPGRERRERPTA